MSICTFPIISFELQHQGHGLKPWVPRVDRELSNGSGRREGGGAEKGVYTPNNRRRPEAPLTSLTKLTPVKNVGKTGRTE